IQPRASALLDLKEFVERNFRPVAEQKSLDFSVELDASLPTHVRTDPQRLQQVLKNLLANAFKFTDQGSVQMRIHTVPDRRGLDNDALHRAGQVLAFSVVDTATGMPRRDRRRWTSWCRRWRCRPSRSRPSRSTTTASTCAKATACSSSSRTT